MNEKNMYRIFRNYFLLLTLKGEVTVKQYILGRDLSEEIYNEIPWEVLKIAK